MMNDPKQPNQGQQNQDKDKQNQYDPNKKLNPTNFQDEQKRREEEEKRKKEHQTEQPARTSSTGSGS
jgi:hypothetical protein